jgi:hypothetical protein
MAGLYMKYPAAGAEHVFVSAWLCKDTIAGPDFQGTLRPSVKGHAA